MARLPLPPLELAERVGGLDPADPFADYLRIGARGAELVQELLPAGWSFEGTSVLDFGCGSGRTIRHFAEEAGTADIVGCDIHAEGIAWAKRHLTPPFRFFRNGAAPPLELRDASLDLVYAISVFTHIDHLWAEWLLELRRVLRPGGLAVLSYLGPGMGPLLVEEPWDEGQIGMTLLETGKSWDEGGPNVLHSEWWLRAHWGRAFEILEILPCSDPETTSGQGLVLLRCPDSPPPSVKGLRAPEPGEPRELAAAAYNVRLLGRELARLRAHRAHEQATSTADIAAARAESEAARAHLAAVFATRAWRATAPLRALRRLR